MNQEAYIGKGSIEKFKEIIVSKSPKSVLLVRGKLSYERCGAKQLIEEATALFQCKIVEFFDFEENPKIDDVLRGIELLNRSSIDLIISIGGGSVIDMAKLIRFYYSYEGNLIGNTFIKAKDLLPIIALPTTSGTGAEATHFAVVYKDKVKYSVAHKDILPDYAIVYPQLTYNNPKYLTACSGFDALAQAIESYWSLSATPESDEYSIKAIKLLYTNIPIVVNNPTNDSRDKVSEGAYWAGRAINITKTTAPHAFSYVLTSYYNYPHGHAVALLFPFFIAYNYGGCNIGKAHKIKMDRLYKMLEIDRLEQAQFVMGKYIQSIGLIKNEAEIDLNLIINSVNLERLFNNPIRVNIKDIKRWNILY